MNHPGRSPRNGGRSRYRQGARSCRQSARPIPRHATGPSGCGTLSGPARPTLTPCCGCGTGTDPAPVHSCRRSAAENHSSLPVRSLRTRICPSSMISTMAPFMPRSSGLTAASSLTTTISPALKSTSGFSPVPVPLSLSDGGAALTGGLSASRQSCQRWPTSQAAVRPCHTTSAQRAGCSREKCSDMNG